MAKSLSNNEKVKPKARIGRPPGMTIARRRTLTLTAEIQQWAAERKIPMPLQVMLEAIGEVYKGKSGKERNAVEAFALAKEAAPYLHPRLQAMALQAAEGSGLQVQVLRFTGNIHDPIDVTPRTAANDANTDSQ